MPEHQQTQQSKIIDNTSQRQTILPKQIPTSHQAAIIQRARIDPKSLSHADVMQLQRTIGNRAVGKLLSEIGMAPSTAKPVQRQGIPEEQETCPSCMQRQEIPEEEEPLQGKFISTDASIQRQEITEEEEPLHGKMAETIQRQEIPEEEEPLQYKMIGTIQRQEIPVKEELLQGMFENDPETICPSCFSAPIMQKQELEDEEKPFQGKIAEIVRRQEIPEEEEPLQGKFESIQNQDIPEEEEPLQTKRENNTGMPDYLKAEVESLSGIDMSDVRVHYNSDKPAKVGALAYTQGTDIHVAPGQEEYLSHEAWHVVQQAQGRVMPTMQLKDVAMNDDVKLEREADVMGLKVIQGYNFHKHGFTPSHFLDSMSGLGRGTIMQRSAGIEYETSIEARLMKPNDYKEEEHDNYIGVVPQDEKMLQANGWYIESDNSKLEFVTLPFDIKTLELVVNDMLDNVVLLPNSLLAPEYLSKLLQRQTTKKYIVLPYTKPIITGSPQGTIGIPFNRLFSFFDLLTRYKMNASDVLVGQHENKLNDAWKEWIFMSSETEQESEVKEKRFRVLSDAKEKLMLEKASGKKPISDQDVKYFRDIADKVSTIVAKINSDACNFEDRERLKGLLHFIGQYIIYSQGEGTGYKKKRFPVMSRSSFNSMYEALGDDAKTHFPTVAKELVNSLNVQDTMTLFPNQMKKPFNISQWLESIYKPINMQIPDKKGYHSMKSDLMTAPGVDEPGFDTDKSMGSMPLYNGLVVVELRTIKAFNELGTFTVNSMRKFVQDLNNLIQWSS